MPSLGSWFRACQQRLRMTLNRGQCRAARALLDWSQEKLADQAGVTTKTIADFERGATTPYARTITMITAALELAGIELLNGGAPGARLVAPCRAQQ